MAGRVIDRLTTVFAFEIDRSGLRTVENRVQRLRDGLNKFASAVAIPGAVLSAGLAGVTRTFFNFEVAQNQLQATLGVSGEAMKDLRGQAKLLGRTTQFSATQASEAQNQLAQAGFNANEILAATPEVLALASAGQLEMSDAAKLVANQLRAFTLDVDQAGRVSDVLAVAAAKSNTSVLQLGPALRQVAPIANAAGMSIEQTAASIGVLRNNGFAAEQAGTAMRAVLSRLLNPAKEAQDVLKGVGLDPQFIKDEVKAGRFAEVLGTLNEAGLTVDQAMKLFGQEAGAAGLVLARNYWQTKELTDQFHEAAGGAQRMADVQNQGLVGSVRNLISAFEGLQIALGEDGIGGAVEFAARKLTELTNWLTESEGWVKQLIAGVLVGGPALLALGAAAKGMAFALGGLRPILSAVRGAVWLFNAAIWANPIGLIIAGIAALIGLIIAAVVYWDEITAAVERAITAFLEWLGVDDPDPFGWLTRAYQAVLDLLNIGVDGFLGWVFVVIDDPFGWLLRAWESLKAALVWVGDLWGWVREQLPSPFQWLLDYWTALIAFLIAPAAGIWGWLFAGEDPFAPVRDAWNALMALLEKPLNGFLSWLGVEDPDVFGWIGRQFQAVADGLWDMLPQSIRDLLEGIAFTEDAFGWVKDQFSAAVQALWDLLPVWFQKFITGDFTIPGQETIEAAGDAVSDAATSAYEGGKQAFNAVGEGISDAGEAVAGAASGVMGRVRDFLGGSDAKVGPMSDATASGAALMKAVSDGIRMGGGYLEQAMANTLPSPLQMLGLPLPVGPSPAAMQTLAAGAPGAAGAGGRSINLSIERIEILAEGGDPQQIAGRIYGALEDEMRRAVEVADTQVVV